MLVKFKLVDDKELIKYIKSNSSQNDWIIQALYKIMQQEKSSKSTR